MKIVDRSNVTSSHQHEIFVQLLTAADSLTCLELFVCKLFCTEVATYELYKNKIHMIYCGFTVRTILNIGMSRKIKIAHNSQIDLNIENPVLHLHYFESIALDKTARPIIFHSYVKVFKF